MRYFYHEEHDELKSLSNVKKSEAQRRTREMQNKWWCEKAEAMERIAILNDTRM